MPKLSLFSPLATLYSQWSDLASYSLVINHMVRFWQFESTFIQTLVTVPSVAEPSICFPHFISVSRSLTHFRPNPISLFLVVITFQFIHRLKHHSVWGSESVNCILRAAPISLQLTAFFPGNVCEATNSVKMDICFCGFCNLYDLVFICTHNISAIYFRLCAFIFSVLSDI